MIKMERFSMSVVKPKPSNHYSQSEESKILLRANENSKWNQPNCLKRGKTRVTGASRTGFSFAPDWLREWFEFCGPITE